MRIEHLGRMTFQSALQRQESALRDVREGPGAETVFLLEHEPVFTLGRSGDRENLLENTDRSGNRFEVVPVNRGGDITFHGPGQLVGYPVLDLRRRGRDVHRYLRSLEDVLIGTARHFGVTSFRREGLTGVWTESGKLASIGVGVRHWITLHGFALNVCNDLSYFSMIHPCGIRECPVTSLSLEIGHPVSLTEVSDVVVHQLGGHLRADPESQPVCHV